MKKFLVAILVLVLCLVPFSARAEESKEYETLNLDEALKEEEIDHDFSNYSETDDQITIYLFRGKGCAYCKKFLTFLNSIVDEYGKYFKVVSYEVWYNNDNAELMSNVESTLGKSADGVPFIVIGDKSFAGYSDEYDDEIKEAIKTLYESEDRYDVMDELNKNASISEEDSNATSGELVLIVLVNLFFIAVATLIIVLFNNKNKNEILEQLNEISKDKKNKKGAKNEA